MPGSGWTDVESFLGSFSPRGENHSAATVWWYWLREHTPYLRGLFHLWVSAGQQGPV